MKQAIVCILVFLTIVLCVSTLFAVLVPLVTGHADGMTSAWTLVCAATYSVFTVLFFWRAGWATMSRKYLDRHQWGVLFWASTAAIGVVLPSIWIQEMMPPLPNVVENELGALMMTPGSYFVLAIIVPLSEELVFRGAVLRSLLAWHGERAWLMIALSALFFALVHMNPAQMPHAFVMGLLLGWMYWRTGSIVPSFVFHLVNNTAAFVLYRAYPDPDICLADIFSGSQTAVVLAVIFSLLILLPSLFELNKRLD